MERFRARSAAQMIGWCVFLLLVALATRARAQSFPFNDAFASYPPGSAGTPAWSILGGVFNASDGILHAPITLRYNGRPPALYTVEATVSVAEGAPEADGLLAAAGFDFNMQHDADTGSSDNVALTFRASAGGVAAGVENGVDMPAAKSSMSQNITDPGRKDVPIRLVVDAENGRYAFFVGDKAALSGVAAEYAAGLLAVRLRGTATLDNLVLRAPTTAESEAVQNTDLFNDPRDVATGEDGRILVLNRSSPAVLSVTLDGEVAHRFARRMPGSVPDPVALARGSRDEVLILNRFPGEVVAYDRNGGLRYRFGAGVLKEPSDIAVRANGSVYVADPAAGKVFVFGPAGRYLGAIADFAGASGAPSRISVDSMDNLAVSLGQGARTVVLRPAADNVSAAFVREEADGPRKVVAASNGETWALWNGEVAAWPRVTADAPAFTGAAVGGLESDGLLARCGDRVAVLERRRSRLVFVPADLHDIQPSITMQNVADTAAIVRWTSGLPSRQSRARLLRGSTWDAVTVEHTKADTNHQALLERLTPGTAYRYELSPTAFTIPPADWSSEFTFTAGRNTPPASKPVKGEAP